ncbi:MAG: YbaB/EbfC family nucleoid-associated protein [Gammaproteobacteria bacterium HGW-Gammaproteobacteria-8]|nr:MAG: YbaB/EbfC family nucleoid-associated protein [Gammaproteobacteria bacterium HGW-Gammaproteobacteria-8]
MKASIAQLMQQAQKMQENLKQAQQELAQLEIVGEAGAGMVEIRMNGRHEVRSVKIDAGAMEDREMLEDLLAAAFNDAVNRIQEANQDKLSGLAGGLPLPPGFTLP